MGVIKQIAVHDGQSWGNPKDIGANAENVSYNYINNDNNNNISISNAEQAFNNIFSRVLNLEQTSDLSTLQGRVGALETDNTTNKTNINTLTGQINGLNNNKLSTSGGTLSGDLILENENSNSHNLILNQSDLLANSGNIIITDNIIGNETSANEFISSGLFLNSEDYQNYAGIQGYQKVDSNIPYLRINNERTVNGSLSQNNLLMGIDNHGTSIIQMSDPSAWRKALLSGTQSQAWKKSLDMAHIPNYSDYSLTNDGGKIKVYSLTTAKTIANGLVGVDAITCNLKDVAPGIYLCIAKATWKAWGNTQPNSRPGCRILNVTKTSKQRSGGTINYMNSVVTYNQNQDFIQNCVGWYKVTGTDSLDGTKIYLVCAQNSPASVTVNGVYFIMIPLAIR